MSERACRRLGWFLVLTIALAGREARAAATRRFTVLIGANDGGASRARLRYAVSDAKAVAKVFRDLGGVAAADQLLLIEPSRAVVQSVLGDLRSRLARLRALNQRTELVVYYSGHSDEEGLLLGGERVGYVELREWLNSLPSNVRIAILDSCASGVLTRRKGGTRVAPFLMDQSSQMQGHAFITSSAADEAAQESDRVGASFFTHYFISGLRGAADLSHDGRVTLTEAYQFAFNETLARTEKTQSGPQHATYDMQLAGSGDLVVTDLHAVSAGLSLPEEMSGRLYIRDASEGLVAELHKPLGRSIDLGLEPGPYRILLEKDGRLFTASITLAPRQHAALGFAAFSPVAIEGTRPRGEIAGSQPAGHDAQDALSHPPIRCGEPIAFSLTSWLSTNRHCDHAYNHFALNIWSGYSGRVHGVELGVGLNRVLNQMHGVQLSFFAGNVVHGQMRGDQSALFFNYAGGSAMGLQLAFVFNRAALFDGLQLAVVTNLAFGEVKGAQLGGGFNYAQGDVVGMQVAMVANASSGRAIGIQTAMGGNLAREGVSGIQAAIGFNYAGGVSRGLQAGSGFNVAREVGGLQLSLINVAEDLTGAQVGLINVARKVKGVQFGLVNIAEHVDGASLGPVSYVDDVPLRWQVWSSDLMLANLTLKYGSKHFYWLMGIGANPFVNPVLGSLGLGFGGHVPIGRAFVDLDSAVYWLPSRVTAQVFMPQARLYAGWQFFSHLAIFAGVHYSFLFQQGPDRIQSPTLFKAIERTQFLGNFGRLNTWPGVFVGAQF